MEKVGPVHQPQQSVQPACGAFPKVVHLQMCTELPQAMNWPGGPGHSGHLTDPGQAAASNRASCILQRWNCILGTRGAPHHTRTALRAALMIKAAC